MKIKAVLAAALFTLGMGAAVAIAKPPPGSPAAAKLAAKAAHQRASELKCRGGHMNLGGTVTSIDLGGSQFVIDVLRANRKGRDLVGHSATLSVGDKTKMNPKSKSSLDKLAVGDRVKALVRMCRDAEGDAALMAKFVVAHAPAQEEATSESTSTETSTTESTSTETSTTESTSTETTTTP